MTVLSAGDMDGNGVEDLLVGQGDLRFNDMQYTSSSLIVYLNPAEDAAIVKGHSILNSTTPGIPS